MATQNKTKGRSPSDASYKSNNRLGINKARRLEKDKKRKAQAAQKAVERGIARDKRRYDKQQEFSARGTGEAQTGQGAAIVI
jgi:hypothetical protein